MNIDYFLEGLFRPSGDNLFGFADVMMAMIVATLLSTVLAHVYRVTHRGMSYSQSFLVTLFLMSVTTAVIMMIIGSNIARAFSLVGALSVIRFRTAVKDSRDTGFLFASIAVGMACGTQFYMPGIAMTAFIAFIILLLDRIEFGSTARLENVLRVTFSDAGDVLEKIEQELDKEYKSFTRINRILDVGSAGVTNVYLVRPKKDSDDQDLEKRLTQLEGVKQLSVYQSESHSPV